MQHPCKTIVQIDFVFRHDREMLQGVTQFRGHRVHVTHSCWEGNRAAASGLNRRSGPGHIRFQKRWRVRDSSNSKFSDHCWESDKADMFADRSLRFLFTTPELDLNYPKVKSRNNTTRPTLKVMSIVSVSCFSAFLRYSVLFGARSLRRFQGHHRE